MPDATAYEYVLFIDEAGDDGLRKVRPIDPDGSSEWLCLGATLIRAANEAATIDWVKKIRAEVRSTQGTSLHYNRLSLDRRRRACELLAALPCRCFAVCSHKVNMRQHENPRAAARGGKQVFYNWLIRLLLERVTDYCYRRSMRELGRPGVVKIILSLRGGHGYGQTKGYLEILKRQSIGGTTYLRKWEVNADVLRFNLVDYLPHKQVAGLQLADLVASAFYQAADANGPNWNIEPAKMLRPRMARHGSEIEDYGVVLQPAGRKARLLTPAQQSIFLEYGHKF